MMKYGSYLSLLLLILFSCKREAPMPVDSFRLQLDMPAECREEIRYAGKTVYFRGAEDYTFRTDARGGVDISSLIPGIYDINTYVELSGRAYKAMLKVEDPTIADDDRLMLGVSLMNRRIFRAEDLTLQLLAMQLSDLVISKVYYSGTKDKMERNYTADTYVELFNNSDRTVYADGLYLALAESVSPAAYPAKDNPDSIYARQICRFPGSGTDYPLAPGSSLLVAARSARNHRESAPTSVDLSVADFEVKLEEGMGNPDVRRLPIISNSTTLAYFNLISGGPNAVFLFATDEDVVNTWPEVYQRGKTSGERFRRIHRHVVLDGVECLKNPSQSAPDVNTKRLPDQVDAGFVTIDAVNGYNGQSVERRVSRFENGRYYLVDTNNSSSDFVTCNDPTPGKYDKEGLQ